MAENPIAAGQHYCPDCNQIVDLAVTPAGRHLRGSCSICGRWLKWVPHDINPGDEMLYFGKHKGKKYSEIPVDYLRWVLDNCERNLSGRQKKNLVEYLRTISEASHGK
jgi:hypothetical protein